METFVRMLVLMGRAHVYLARTRAELDHKTLIGVSHLLDMDVTKAQFIDIQDIVEIDMKGLFATDRIKAGMGIAEKMRFGLVQKPVRGPWIMIFGTPFSLTQQAAQILNVPPLLPYICSAGSEGKQRCFFTDCGQTQRDLTALERRLAA